MTDSLLDMPGQSFAGVLPELSAEQRVLKGLLQRHVCALAEDIGPRSVFVYDALLQAETYIRDCWAAIGCRVTEQPYVTVFADSDLDVRNLWVDIQGKTQPETILLVGAHYDTVGYDCPGANDNASGIAALLELSRMLLEAPLGCTVRFAAFVNEEPPFFLEEAMGSMVYARLAKEERQKIRGMISLETLGCYSNEEGSQSYPQPLSLRYPKRGNFIGFVGNLPSIELLRTALGAFREEARFPSEGLAAAAAVPGIEWSDHVSFWRYGFPAIMVTDTALFRYPHYHEPTDTSDRLDYDSFARVVSGLVPVIRRLAR